MHATKAIAILQVSFIHIHMWRCMQPKPLLFYKCHSYTFIYGDARNQSHCYFTSVIHTHSYVEMHATKAIGILQVTFIHIHMWRCTQPKPLLFYKCHSYTFICGDARNQSHCYFTSAIHAHSYVEMLATKAIAFLQVSFIHIHMWRCSQPKPLVFCKCHSYTFICEDARNQSHWYFTSVIQTHPYVEMLATKAIGILQVSFIHIHMQRWTQASCINEWISLDNLSYLAIQIRTMVTTFQNWDIVIQYQYIYWWLKNFVQEKLLPTSFHNHADPDFFPW